MRAFPKSLAWAVCLGVVPVTGASAQDPTFLEARRALEAALARTAAVSTAVASLETAVASLETTAASRRMALERLAARAGAPAPRGARRSTAPRAPAPWLQQDAGDSTYRSARAALNRGDHAEAARLFAELRRAHPRSGYVPDSYYYEAFARYRLGGTEELNQARDLLRQQAELHSDAATRGDARSLQARIQGALAQRGDAASFSDVQEQAAGPCRDEDQGLRAMALSALLNMDAERALPILREVLRSRDDCSVELRRRAVFLVSQKLTDETVDILLDLAHRDPDPDAQVREQAVFWLSQVRRPEAVGALESILRSSTDARMQEKALFALSQHRDARAGEVLRTYAERADAPEKLRENAIFWLGQRGTPETSAYLRGLYGRIGERKLKEKIVFSLSQSRQEEDRRWLLERARDASEDVALRKNALFWAGQAGVSIGELTSLYSELGEREMKEQVVFALSQRREPEAVDALMEIARTEDDPRLRERAVFWLGQSRDPRAAEFLFELIRRP